MDDKERMEFDQCLNKMFYLFARIAKLDMDEEVIGQYLEIHDEAKTLLSKDCKGGETDESNSA